MRYINKITAEPFQTMFLTGNAGQRIQMNLRYTPTQQTWIADFILDDFSLRGINLVKSPNLLRGYHNFLPFGITCTTADGQDPRNLDDFQSQYAALYLMTQEEVEQMEVEAFE